MKKIVMIALCAVGAPICANEFVIKKPKIKERKSTLEQVCLEELSEILKLIPDILRAVSGSMQAADCAAVAQLQRSVADVHERCLRSIEQYVQNEACALFVGKDKHGLQQLAQDLKQWQQDLKRVLSAAGNQQLSALNTALEKQQKLLRV